MDIECISSNLGMDSADVVDLIRLFVEITQRDLEKICRAMDGNMPADAACAAHSIKGAAGNLGLDEIYDIAMTMETKAKQGDLRELHSYMTNIEALLERLLKQLPEA